MTTGPPTPNIVDKESRETSTSRERAVSSIVQDLNSGGGTLLAQLRLSEDHLQDFDSHPNKRRKTTGGLRVRQANTVETPDDNIAPSATGNSSARRLQTKSREFPQRKMKTDQGVHELQPSSVEKFVAGLWKQMFTSIDLTLIALVDFLQTCIFLIRLTRSEKDNPYAATAVGSGSSIEVSNR